MTQKLTRKGARNVTSELDRIASLVQDHHPILGVPEKVAFDFAKRCDLISDAIETLAVQNARSASEAEEVTDDDPESKDQNKPESYYEGKTASPEFPVEPAEDETGESVEPIGDGFDPNAIGDDRGGPFQHESDEPYMSGEFSQVEFHQLHDKQVSGELPGVDPKLASAIDGLDADNAESIARFASLIREVVGADKIRTLPGLSPMQLRSEIDRLAELRREIEMVSAQFEDTLKKLKGLEADEKKGLGQLKEAAASLQQKGKYVADAEKAILQFEARVTAKVPGIEQMIASPGDKKFGEKAGDLFGRIGRELGKEVADQVEAIYAATKEDLTHTTTAIYGLKIVAKTASMDAATMKQAGISDVVISVKEWLAGKADAVAQRVMKFTGDLTKWVKGFVFRTKQVEKAKTSLEKSLGSALQNVDKLLAQAKQASDASEDSEEASEEAASKQAAYHGFNLFE